MRTFVFVLTVGVACATPFPTPAAEPIVPCTGWSNETICGNDGECKSVVLEQVVGQTTPRTELRCVCDEKYGTWPGDTLPCTRQRTSKALAFWLQLFFGWIQVGAFVLHWWLYGASVFIVYALICTMACTVACCVDHRGQDDALSDGKAALQCFNCCGSLVVLVMWVVTLVYLCTDCYSVVMVDGAPTAFKCWENL